MMRLRPVSRARAARSGVAGKLGIIRLAGKPLKALRRARLALDGFRCVDCGDWLTEETMELAHRRGKRNYGDILENVSTKCHGCHHREHNPKAVPPKPRNVG
jgi:5-methylcytosine-specific restriction endonuclease McrA